MKAMGNMREGMRMGWNKVKDFAKASWYAKPTVTKAPGIELYEEYLRNRN
jgi:hypothetical protein